MGETTEATRSEEHTSELQSRLHLVCRLLLEKKKKNCMIAYVMGPVIMPRASRTFCCGSGLVRLRVLCTLVGPGGALDMPESISPSALRHSVQTLTVIDVNRQVNAKWTV